MKIQGNIDKLLLNATAVSDFKKALRKKQTMQLSENGAQKTNRYIRHVGVNRNQKYHSKYSLTFDDLHQNALP